MIAGGWEKVAVSSPEVKAAAAFAVSHMPTHNVRFKRIASAEQQVVAGMNYRLTLVLAGGKRWHTVVWRKLDGSMELTMTSKMP